MSKIIWIIIAVWTGGDGKDAIQFAELSFTTKKECVQYVKINYESLNNNVNKSYNSHQDTPNIFYCTTPDKWKNLLKQSST